MISGDDHDLDSCLVETNESREEQFLSLRGRDSLLEAVTRDEDDIDALLSGKTDELIEYGRVFVHT